MPTYDYRCDACEHTFEEFQSITSKSLRKCPECGKLKLKRLIGTGAGVLFRGSGFYETDYRSESYKKAAKAEADGGKSTSDKSSGDKSSAKGEGTSKSSEASSTNSTPTDSSKPKKTKD